MIQSFPGGSKADVLPRIGSGHRVVGSRNFVRAELVEQIRKNALGRFVKGDDLVGLIAA